MTQSTYFNDTDHLTQDSMSMLMRALFQSNPATQSYLNNQLNELAVTNPSGNTVRVASGRAIVHGTWYENSANLDFTVTIPGAGVKCWSLILRKDWSAGTVRAAVAGGGDTPYSLVQTDGVTWEVPLATFKINNVGTISEFTDVRVPTAFNTV